jgi:hypothetical protein
MKFVKETNGNVRVTDDLGENITLIQDIGVRVQAEGLLDYISISQNGFEILKFATADISGTQILPAAEIPFAGTTSDLIQILTDDFFLSSSSGGGGGTTEADAIFTRPTDYRYEVAMGKRQGRTTWNKFGFNADVDTGGQEIVGSFGGTFNIMTTADTLDVVSSSANDTSAGTGAQSVLISGIDANFNAITEIVTLNGTTPVTTTNSFLGVNRAVVLASGSGGVNAGTITIDDTSGTVGTQAELPIGSSVTQQAIFHTQISHNFLADWLFINIRRISGGGTPRCTVRGFSYSRVTGTTYEIFTYRIDTGRENTVELRPSQPFVIGGREVFYFTCETNVNNTTVSLRFSGIEERIL